MKKQCRTCIHTHPHQPYTRFCDYWETPMPEHSKCKYWKRK